MNIMDDVMEDFGVASFCIYKDWVGNFQLLCSVLVVSQLLVIAFLQDWLLGTKLLSAVQN